MDRTNASDLLHLCVQNDQVAPILYLADKGINFNEENGNGETPLWQAASKGSNEVVSLLLTLEQVKIDRPNNNLETPLMVAVKENRVEVVKRLLLKGANREAQNNESKTAYQIAIEDKNKKLARILSLERSFLDRLRILCNKKTVYRPESPSLALVFGFLFVLLTSALPTNVIIQLPLADMIGTGIFYGVYVVLYISLLVGPKRGKKTPLKEL